MVSVVSSQLDYIRENKDAIVEGNVIVKDTACIGSAAHISGTCATSLDSRMWGKRYSNSQYRDQLEFTE